MPWKNIARRNLEQTQLISRMVLRHRRGPQQSHLLMRKRGLQRVWPLGQPVLCSSSEVYKHSQSVTCSEVLCALVRTKGENPNLERVLQKSVGEIGFKGILIEFYWKIENDNTLHRVCIFSTRTPQAECDSLPLCPCCGEVLVPSQGGACHTHTLKGSAWY